MLLIEFLILICFIEIAFLIKIIVVQFNGERCRVNKKKYVFS